MRRGRETHRSAQGELFAEGLGPAATSGAPGIAGRECRAPAAASDLPSPRDLDTYDLPVADELRPADLVSGAAGPVRRRETLPPHPLPTASGGSADGAGAAADPALALGHGRARQVPSSGCQVALAGEALSPLPGGALWWPRRRLLAVADLHLEKGSFYARRGQFFPPYDTAATLARLAAVVAALDPRMIVALGDSFHDDGGPSRLAAGDREAIAKLQRGRDWVWIAGNHDTNIPRDLGGTHADVLTLDGLTFRHEPRAGAAPGEIAGHLHPAALVAGRLGAVRRRCFVGDGSRLVLPAFGAFTGGLNVLADAFAPLFRGSFAAFVLGRSAVYPIHHRHLQPG